MSCEKPPFTDPTRFDLKETLAQKLISTVDNLRDLFTSFGLRPYKVRLVVLRWSGAKVGVGAAVVERAIDILPTPLVADLSTMTAIMNPVGLDEAGEIVVSQISGSFTEDQLRGMVPGQKKLELNQEAFYEIEYPQPDDGPTRRRRFTLRGAPFYAAGKFQWQVRLERAHGERARNGDPFETGGAG